MRKILSLSIGVAVLGFAAGCGGSGDDGAPSTSRSSSTPTATATKAATPTPTKPPGPLTAAQYQASQSQLDQRLASDVRALSTAKSAENQFSTDCSFQKFDQGFGRNEGWQIDLQPSVLGNASTSEVDAY